MDTYPVPDLARYLAGGWSLSRTVSSLAQEASGKVVAEASGCATFTPDAGALTYRERGELTVAGVSRPMSRTLRYELVEPGRGVVRFDTGALFHGVDLRTGYWNANHSCGSDRYAGRYEIHGPDRWRLDWTVSGPAKRHLIRTDFVRA